MTSLAVAVALLFSLTNGLHGAANSVAMLVATRVASPLRAIGVAAVLTLIGPLVLGEAVAHTAASIVVVGDDHTVPVIGAALTGAVAWNIATWLLGLPSSSSHAMLGGLVGAALADAGWTAIEVGGLDGFRPTGLVGVLIGLLLAPLLGLGVAVAGERVMRAVGRRLSVGAAPGVHAGQWASSAVLSLAHGANEGAKAVGLMAVLLAGTRTTTADPPAWVLVSTALALGTGTALGGWSIVQTIGRRLFRVRALDGLVVEGASAAVMVGSTIVGAPVSTSQVLASAVVGAGGGRRRWAHIRWSIVGEILLTWVTTMPGAAVLAALSLTVWSRGTG